MKRIHLVLDEAMHAKMWADKEKRCPGMSWEAYIIQLFGLAPKLSVKR